MNKLLTASFTLLVAGSLSYAGPGCCPSSGKSSTQAAATPTPTATPTATATITTAAASGIAALNAECKAGKASCPKAGTKCSSAEACAGAQSEQASNASRLTTEALRAMVSAGTPMTLLDARSKGYEAQHLPGARNLTSSASEAEISGAVSDKNAMIVTYCGSIKCGASNKLATALRKLGYANVLEYPEGISGWLAAGHPVETSETTN